METLLHKATRDQLLKEPFPHIVIQNALSSEVADQLLREYPSVQVLGTGAQGLVKNGVVPNNEKLRYYSIDVLGNPQLPAIWSNLVKTHLDIEFYHQFLNLFESEIAELYPHLIGHLRSFTKDDIGIRKIDSFHNKKLLIDAEICVDTPVRIASSVKGPHLDNARKLGVMLYYLKSPDDDSVGGDFELSSLEGKTLSLDTDRMVIGGKLKKERVVTYTHNTALFFLNSLSSLHGVSPRQPTQHLRYSFDVAIELPEALFDLRPYVHISLLRKVRSKLSSVKRLITR